MICKLRGMFRGNILKKSIGYKWKKQPKKSLIRYTNSFAHANSLFCVGFFHSEKNVLFLGNEQRRNCKKA